MVDDLSPHYPQYLEYLRKLISMPSVFTQEKDVRKVIDYCKNIFETNLVEYNVFTDEEYNLIAVPKEIDKAQDLIYLSAHVDTVDAIAAEWDSPFQPFVPHEDENELVARGVNDCKAGVAYELLISWLIKEKIVASNNLIFTLTFKEEGIGKKTAKAISKEMGKSLPLSNKNTYLIVLENNVKVSHIPTLCVYSGERSNYIITIDGSVPELQTYLKGLPKWNPVAIKPLNRSFDDLKFNIIEQVGGHVCSVERNINELTKVIFNANKHSLLKAGNFEEFAVVPSKIYVGEASTPGVHRLLISNRSFDSIEDVEKELKDVPHKIIKDFSSSAGYNIEEKLLSNKISKILKQSEGDNIKIEYTYNVGGSDAKTIYNSLDAKVKEKFYPIVMGPGSRSQRSATPPRLTHGKNETFDKESGERAIIYISTVLEGLGCIAEV